MLLHEADNLLFAIGLVRDGHRLFREGLVEIDLVQLQGQLLCHLLGEGMGEWGRGHGVMVRRSIMGEQMSGRE